MRPRRRHRVAAEQRAREGFRILAQRIRERPEPGVLLAPQRQRQHEAGRHGALGGEIGQVHPQRLARDGVGWVGGKIVHTLDHGIGGDDDVVAGRGQDRGIVDQPERTGIGRQRLEIARDEGVFGGVFRCVGHRR
ncbi:hypothetical protein ABIA29_003109 [Bradyrhizobium japonicum]